MHKDFVPLYLYFNDHKVLMYLIMALSVLVFLIWGLRQHFKENISKLLPSSSNEIQLGIHTKR